MRRATVPPADDGPRPAEARPAEARPGEARAVETRPGEARPGGRSATHFAQTAGDGAAEAGGGRYGRLYENLSRPARAMVRRAFGGAFSDEEIEDLYGSAWLSTLRALERKERSLADDELRRYVLTAVANQASRELRRRGRKPTVSIEAAYAVADPAASPDEHAAGQERSRIARDVLGSLPQRRRAVMVLRYGWGLEPSEVCGLVGGLSARAYRREIERGVAEVAKKLRMAENGEWCRSREPLLRSVAAGTAGAEERRQASHHIAHCRHCADFLGKLNGHLHDIGSGAASTGALVLDRADPSVLERAAAVLERGKQGISGVVGRGGEVAEQAATGVATAGGTRGAGAAGAGIAAKLAGLSAVPKVVATCVGTGAAATACVAAGVVPGLSVDRGPEGPKPAAKAELADRRDHSPRPALAQPLPQLNSAPAQPTSPSPASEPVGDHSGTDPLREAEVVAAPRETVSEPAPEVQEFDVVGAPAGATTSGSGGGSGGSAGSTATRDRAQAGFGP